MKNQKKVCKALYFFEHFLVFISGVIGSVSVSAFASLVTLPVVALFVNSALGLNCVITSGIKKV